jgi:excisionase family DNA binding protein
LLVDLKRSCWRIPATSAIRCQSFQHAGHADKILTLPEVAQLLKVAEMTVYRTAKKCQLSAFKVRAQWRFKCVDIDRWMVEQREASRDGGRN